MVEKDLVAIAPNICSLYDWQTEEVVNRTYTEKDKEIMRKSLEILDIIFNLAKTTTIRFIEADRSKSLVVIDIAGFLRRYLLTTD